MPYGTPAPPKGGSKKTKRPGGFTGWLQHYVADPLVKTDRLLYSWPGMAVEKWGPDWSRGAAGALQALETAPIAAAEHPGATVSDAYSMTRGLAETAALFGKSALWHDKKTPTTGELLKELGVGTIKDYRTRYGKNWREEQAKHPLSYLFDDLALLGGGARVASLAGASSRLGEAGLARTPRALWKESAQPGVLSEGAPRVRTYTHQPPGAEFPQTAILPYSHSPLRRASQQIQDELAHTFPNTPMFGARSRTMRAFSRELPRFIDRALASVVGAEALDKLKEPARTRLYYGAQLNDHSAEGLARFRDALAREHATEFSSDDPGFDELLRQAKKAGFGEAQLKRLDKAIKYEPDATYWKAEGALRQATQMAEQLMADNHGFTNIENDIRRAETRRAGMTDPEQIDLADAEIDRLHEQLAEKGISLARVMTNRRNLVKEWGDANAVVDTKERQAWLKVMSEHPNFGPEKAQDAVRFADALANATGDPAHFWKTRIGMPSGEAAQQFMRRAGTALFQSQGLRAERGLVEDTLGLDPARGGDVYYSDLQRWLANPKYPWKQMKAGSLEAALKRHLKPMEFYNAGLDLFFDTKAQQQRVGRQELMAHLRNPLNAYNVQEFIRINDPALTMGQQAEWHTWRNGVLVSRNPAKGEYREFVLQLPGSIGGTVRGARNAQRSEGTAFAHWGIPNVVLHVRVHIFEEDGVRKMLIDEIQSDWESDFRKQLQRREEQNKARRARGEPDLPPLPELGTPEAGEHMAAVSEARAHLHELQVRYSDLEGDQFDAIAAGDREREQQIEQELFDLTEEIGIARREAPQHLVPPSPLGPTYYRAALRRMMREAAEQDVDELILSDPRVQEVRNHSTQLDLGGEGLVDAPADHPALVGDVGKRQRASTESATDWFNRNPGAAEKWDRYSKQFPDFLEKAYGLQGERVGDAYLGRYSSQTGQRSEEGLMPGTRFKLSPQVKQRALLPQSLYQRMPKWGELPKGATELLADGNRVVHMFQTADVSTWIHELSHTAVFDLGEADRKVLADFYGGGLDIEHWKESAHENYARDFELWTREGNAPNAHLTRIFSRIAAWMRQIYRKVDEEHELPPEVEAVFGRMFVNRSDIPDIFIPHRAYAPDLSGARTSRMIPRANREIGDQVMSRVPHFKKNNLVLLRHGMLSDDPRHTFEHLNRLMMMARANQLREAVLDMAKPLSPGESPDFDTQYVVKRAGSSVDKAMFDALENADNPEQIRELVSTFIDDHLGGKAHHEKWMAENEEGALRHGEHWTGKHQIHVVDKKTVDMLFKDVTGKKPGATTGPKSGLGRVGDAFLDSTRAMLLYANPGFYVANMAGNAWMTAFSDPRAFRYFAWSMKNAVTKAGDSGKVDPFWNQVSTEMGRGPTAGQLSTEPGFVGKMLKAKGNRAVSAVEGFGTGLPRWWGGRAGNVIDDSFRVGAWRQAARKRGYTTKEQQQRLLSEAASERGTQAHVAASRARQDLNSIRDEAENLMLDFDSMTPFERTYLSRAIFLYPFLRASVKYPVMFAGERPLVAAGAGALGAAGAREAEQQWGPRAEGLPDWAQGYARTGPGGRYLNVGSIAPMAPLLGMLESAMAVGSAAPIGVNRPLSYLSPLVQLQLEMARSQNKYGRDASWGEILKSELPMPGYLSQLLGLRQPSELYTDRSELASILRSLRVVPFGMQPGGGTSPGWGASSGWGKGWNAR